MAIPKKIRSFLQFILFTGVGVLILVMVYKSQNAAYIAECALKGIPDSECSLMEKLKSDFASVNYYWIAAIIVAFVISNLLRAHRWLLLIKTMGTWQNVQCFFHHHGWLFCQYGTSKSWRSCSRGSLCEI